MSDASRLYATMTCTVALVGAGAAHAADRGVAFAGAMASKAPTAYVGGTIALPGSELGKGLAVRAVLVGNDYRYVGWRGRVKARERAVTLSAVYQWSGKLGYANLAAGATHRDTRLTPDDTNNPNRGKKWDAVIGADGALYQGAWRFAGLSSYQFNLREYYARLDLTRALPSALRLGAEVIVQGNPMYDRQLYGAVAAYPSGKWEFRLSGGALKQRAQNGPYGALSISRVF